MARTRLRKADRIKQAGKGCNTAQYGFGTTKRKDKDFKTHTKESQESVQKWAAAHARKNPADDAAQRAVELSWLSVVARRNEADAAYREWKAAATKSGRFDYLRRPAETVPAS